MLATPAASGILPVGARWAYEVKWDGVRVLAGTAGGSLRLASRAGRDVTPAYPELGGLVEVPDAVLDGEVVAMSDGVPSFAAIAERMHVRDARRAAELARARPVTYVVFDVLRLAGTDLTGRTYDERRAALGLVDLPDHVTLSPVYDDGAELWELTRGHGLEGVVAKRRDSTYRPGARSADWVKAAHRRTRTALVGGWREETGGSGRVGALLLGAYDEHGALRFLGRAGSGLAGPLARRVRELVVPVPVSPFGDAVPEVDARGAHWCDPGVVVDVRYLQRGSTGRLRQPVVRGVRDDTAPDPWETP